MDDAVDGGEGVGHRREEPHGHRGAGIPNHEGVADGAPQRDGLGAKCHRSSLSWIRLKAASMEAWALSLSASQSTSTISSATFASPRGMCIPGVTTATMGFSIMMDSPS